MDMIRVNGVMATHFIHHPSRSFNLSSSSPDGTSPLEQSSAAWTSWPRRTPAPSHHSVHTRALGSHRRPAPTHPADLQTPDTHFSMLEIITGRESGFHNRALVKSSLLCYNRTHRHYGCFCRSTYTSVLNVSKCCITMWISQKHI